MSPVLEATADFSMAILFPTIVVYFGFKLWKVN